MNVRCHPEPVSTGLHNSTAAPSTIPIMPFGCRRTSVFEKMSYRMSSKRITYTSSTNAFTHLQATTMRLPPHENDENGTQCYAVDEDDGFFLMCPGQLDNIELPPRLNDVSLQPIPTSATLFSTIKPRFFLQPRLTRQPLFE